MHGELTFDHDGNPLLVRKLKAENLPKVTNEIKIKEYFIDEATFQEY
jgi:hypothetical protein